MSLFVEFEDNQYKHVQARFDALFGMLKTVNGENSYFDAINQDLKVANTLLIETTQETQFHDKAYRLQEEYNQALALAKERWGKSEKGFKNGAIIIKDLTARRKAYDSSVEVLKQFEKKLALLSSYTSTQTQDNNLKHNLPWVRLQAKAMMLDKKDKEDFQRSERIFQIQGETRVERLKNLGCSWQSQGNLVKGNMHDLLTLYEELDNLDGFLDFICNTIKADSTHPCDIKILNMVRVNRQLLIDNREKCKNAIGWRIQAAISTGNLRCDDSLLGLARELKFNVFHDVGADELQDVSDLLEIPDSVKTFEMSFDDFTKALAILKHNNDYWYQKWLNSRWVKNTDKNNLVEVVVKDNVVIPKCIEHVIPSKPSFTPDSWVRYWFFRTTEKLGIFASWLREKLVGKYDETVTLVNETYRQLVDFEKKLTSHRSAGFVMSLNHITNSPAFIAALKLPAMMQSEMNRAEIVRPSWTIGILLSKIPFFNRYATYQLFSLYRTNLSEARKTIALKYRKIAQYIVEDFETLILNSIEAKSFTFQEELISTLEKFIRLYGQRADIEKFKRISDPIYILQKFDFLLPATQSSVRTLNIDAIITFTSFAQKYWPVQEFEAIKAILNIINRSEIPLNENDDTALMFKISCLLKGEDKKKEFKELMNLVAMKYLFVTGDDGSDDAYQFLKRHAPDAANNWKSKRQLDIEEKFVFINKILLDGLMQECDLTNEEPHEVGELQLRYNNYGLYISDIREDDKVNVSNKEALLHQAAQRYIRVYNGNNSFYADLLACLCAPDKLSILASYVKKRFAFLINPANREEFLVKYDDYRFFSKISHCPEIVETVIKVINELYHGEDIEDAELILAFNHPQVNALYFGKRVEHYIVNGNYEALNRDKAIYLEYLGNHYFSEHIETVLSDHFDALIQRRDWDKLESAELSELVESFGGQQNKETYRLLRINRLLKRNDSDATRDYLSEISRREQGSLEVKLFTLPRAKILLERSLLEQVAQLREQHKWEGHTQYFLEFFLGQDKKNILHDFRLAWFSEYFTSPHKFADANALERSFLEAKFHYQNKEVPNDEIDIETFFGTANIKNVKAVMMDALDNVENLLDDDHLNIINRYLKDKAFTLDNQWPLFTKKFEIYQKIIKMARMANNGQYIQVVKHIEHFGDEIKGLEALNTSDASAQRESIIKYNKKMLTLLHSQIERHFKNRVANQELLEKLETQDYLKIHSQLTQEREVIFQLVSSSKLDANVKESINSLNAAANEVMQATIEFVKNLHFNALHLIEPSEENLINFRKNLSQDTKLYLIKRIEVICGFLPTGDPLLQALTAFVRLLRAPEDLLVLDKNDLGQLNLYRVSQRNYPQMANDMAVKLIQILSDKNPLSLCSIFNELKGTYQSAFLNDMPVRAMISLMRALKAKIEWIVVTQNAVTNEQRNDWLNHARLYEWLTLKKGAEQNNLKLAVNQWSKGCLDDAKKSLLALIEKFDNVTENKDKSFEILLKSPNYMPKPQTREEEAALLKSALFVRSFGDDLQKKSLDKLLSEVARRQRKIMMMANSSSFVEHCLEYADRLLNLAGNDQQRLECTQLHDTWNRYRVANIAGVRHVAVKDAIPQYINDFDSAIFQYFIEKHNLNANFTQLMLDYIDRWQLNDELIEPNLLLKKHPISEFHQILIEQARVQKHGLFYSSPSVNDAQKLFVAFCLMMQAHQLAQVWEKRERQDNQLLRNFKPEDISEPLSLLVNRLSKQFDIGNNKFNKSISKAIHKDKENFASWSAIDMPVEQNEQNLRARFA